MKPEIKLAKMEEAEWWLDHLISVAKAMRGEGKSTNDLEIERNNHLNRLKKQ